jgi:hypothetical protein
VKIYAAATVVEAVKKKEIQEGESQFTTETEVPPPPLNANVFYFFKKISPYLWIKLRVLVLFSLLYR